MRPFHPPDPGSTASSPLGQLSREVERLRAAHVHAKGLRRWWLRRRLRRLQQKKAALERPWRTSPERPRPS